MNAFCSALCWLAFTLRIMFFTRFQSIVMYVVSWNHALHAKAVWDWEASRMAKMTAFLCIQITQIKEPQIISHHVCRWDTCCGRQSPKRACLTVGTQKDPEIIRKMCSNQLHRSCAKGQHQKICKLVSALRWGHKTHHIVGSDLGSCGWCQTCVAFVSKKIFHMRHGCFIARWGFHSHLHWPAWWMSACTIVCHFLMRVGTICWSTGMCCLRRVVDAQWSWEPSGHFALARCWLTWSDYE